MVARKYAIDKLPFLVNYRVIELLARSSPTPFLVTVSCSCATLVLVVTLTLNETLTTFYLL